MYLARKITLSKWEAQQGLSEDEIAADAVTADLRTQKNSLSFWRCCPETNGDVEKAVLAIASAGRRIDKIDMIWLDGGELRNDDQTLENTGAKTPAKGVDDIHFDVCRLDYVRLGKIARCVVNAIKQKRYRRFTRKHVKKLLMTAVEQDRIDFDELDDGIKKVLGTSG